MQQNHITAASNQPTESFWNVVHRRITVPQCRVISTKLKSDSWFEGLRRKQRVRILTVGLRYPRLPSLRVYLCASAAGNPGQYSTFHVRHEPQNDVCSMSGGVSWLWSQHCVEILCYSLQLVWFLFPELTAAAEKLKWAERFSCMKLEVDQQKQQNAADPTQLCGKPRINPSEDSFRPDAKLYPGYLWNVTSCI